MVESIDVREYMDEIESFIVNSLARFSKKHSRSTVVAVGVFGQPQYGSFCTCAHLVEKAEDWSEEDFEDNCPEWSHFQIDDLNKPEIYNLFFESGDRIDIIDHRGELVEFDHDVDGDEDFIDPFYHAVLEVMQRLCRNGLPKMRFGPLVHIAVQMGDSQFEEFWTESMAQTTLAGK